MGRAYATAGSPLDSPIPRGTRACGSPKPSWPPATGERRRASSPPLQRWPSGSARLLLAVLIADVAGAAELGQSRAPALDGLTAREREILTMVVSGSSNRDIATALFISPKTVSVHVSALLRRLGVSGSADRSAAMQAGELGAPPYGSTR